MSYFENCNFAIFHQFCSIKIDLSGNTGLSKSRKSTNFGIFNELLSTQYVNVARFARNVVKCDFFWHFQTW